MAQHDTGDVTALLVRWGEGDRAALDALVPLVYNELRRVGRARLRSERDSDALQTTALVHEVYLRLVDGNRLAVESRVHFFAVAARLMRQILVDHARRRHAGKRGGGVTLVALDPGMPEPSPDLVDVLALDAGLDELSRLDERLSRVVELRFFAGLTIAETATALKVSAVTVEREWAFAKAWLYHRLSGGSDLACDGPRR